MWLLESSVVGLLLGFVVYFSVTTYRARTSYWYVSYGWETEDGKAGINGTRISRTPGDVLDLPLLWGKTLFDAERLRKHEVKKVCVLFYKRISKREHNITAGRV